MVFGGTTEQNKQLLQMVHAFYAEKNADTYWKNNS
jgi:hypothetical protein